MYACLPCLRALRFRREAPLSPQGASLLCRPPPQESDAPDALVDRDDPGHAGAGQKAQIKHIWQEKRRAVAYASTSAVCAPPRAAAADLAAASGCTPSRSQCNSSLQQHGHGQSDRQSDSQTNIELASQRGAPGERHAVVRARCLDASPFRRVEPVGRFELVLIETDESLYGFYD